MMGKTERALSGESWMSDDGSVICEEGRILVETTPWWHRALNWIGLFGPFREWRPVVSEEVRQALRQIHR